MAHAHDVVVERPVFEPSAAGRDVDLRCVRDDGVGQLFRVHVNAEDWDLTHRDLCSTDHGRSAIVADAVDQMRHLVKARTLDARAAESPVIVDPNWSSVARIAETESDLPIVEEDALVGSFTT